VHTLDARGEVAGEHAVPGAYLENDVVRPELSEPADHVEDVPVGQEMLAVLLLHSPKHAVALRSTCSPSSRASSPRASASASTVCTTYAGSFRLPRTGCGARYGQSVSARILSAGTWVSALRSSGAFLYVTLPAIEVYRPRSSAAGGSRRLRRSQLRADGPRRWHTRRRIVLRARPPARCPR